MSRIHLSLSDFVEARKKNDLTFENNLNVQLSSSTVATIILLLTIFEEGDDDDEEEEEVAAVAAGEFEFCLF